ncbi:glycosyltransferase [Coleofasciculus sp. FACHB-1120]|uniref:glycosyltransferase n=1 Tax=Coleofasciculus sp. FACHB-1120 TaxID=2692783 RepID=UPI00168296FA|nr:glycosyltransferase [Coleofasciculus sp. FACHB-1120]MBD2740588.1 glycosyltransferase [Coleofasciculus sp. FACHB-1120]
MNQRKRIAFLVPNLEGGGLQRVALNLLKGLALHDVSLDLVLASAQGTYLKDIPSGVRVIDLKTPIQPRLKSASRVTLPLINYLRQEKPDALVSHLYTCNVVAVIAKKLAMSSAKLALVEHISLYEKKARENQLRENFLPISMRWLYPRADAVVAVSKGLARELETYLEIKQGSIQSIYNPVVNENLLRKAESPVNHPWFRDGEPPVVLGVGRLVKQKDFCTLIHAFSLVRQVRPARLVILGEGSEKSKLIALVRELGLEDDVAMLGFVDSPSAYMARAAVFVLSSILEGLPTVLIEAMAVGTPVISTNCESGPDEILDNGNYGLLVPVGNTKAMAEAILSVLSGDSKPVNSAWLDQFTLESATQKYLDILGFTDDVCKYE